VKVKKIFCAEHGLQEVTLFGGEFPAQFAPPVLLVDGKDRHSFGDADKLLGRSQTIRTAGNNAGPHLAFEASNPDHEEFIEVIGGNRQKPHPLQQRVVWIGGFLQHPTVEMEPGKFPVDVTAAAIGREEPLGCGFVMV